MRRSHAGRSFAAVTLAVALGGCSATSNLMGNIDEPSGTPARPAAVSQYPAVHDMPPPRPDQPLTDEQQVQMEKNLEQIRDLQEARDGDSSGQTGKTSSGQTGKKTVQSAKKAAGPPIQIVPAGSKPNP